MEDEKALVKEDADLEANKDAIDEAVSSCPTECIIVEE
jgi:ferredoxin